LFMWIVVPIILLELATVSLSLTSMSLEHDTRMINGINKSNFFIVIVFIRYNGIVYG